MISFKPIIVSDTSQGRFCAGHVQSVLSSMHSLYHL